MSLPPARPAGRNLLSVGLAIMRIALPHKLGMGRTKRLLPLLQTRFAAALAPIRDVASSIERVQRLVDVAERAGLHRLTGYAGFRQAVRVLPVAIKLVLGFVLVTGLAALRDDAIEIDFPAGQCYDCHCSMPLREGLDWGVCHSACRLGARARLFRLPAALFPVTLPMPPGGRPEHHDGSFGFTPLPAAALLTPTLAGFIVSQNVIMLVQVDVTYKCIKNSTIL